MTVALTVLESPGTAVQRAGRCTGCGRCCETIVIPRRVWDWMQAMARWVAEGGSWDETDHHRDAAFISEYWHPNPNKECSAASVVLTCDAYDAEAKRCTRYFERPPVCRGFPWYGDRPNAEKLHNSDCGYWLDLPTDSWPADFDPDALLAR